MVPTLSTTAITSIAQTTATSGGNITDNGGASVIARGVCWNTATGPTLANSKTSDATGSGSFASSLTGLAASTTYYVRAYATNSAGTAYGNEVSFTTLCTAPSATTNAATSVSNTTATLNGTVNANNFSTTVSFDYGTTISYGITITASQSPVTGSSNTSVSAGVTSLSPNTLYHFRVNTVNCGGTIYGTDQTFTTLCTAPSATTDAATNILPTTAQINGTVNANNFSTAVIFEYGTTTSYGSGITAIPSPVTGNNNISVFATALPGLTPNTVYHYRVKAVNCGGTVYGNDQTFTTLCPSSLTTTHTAGSVAPVTKTNVTYGIVQTNLSGATKCWITQNLGAYTQAISATDATEAAAGWYWQFNRQQGYKHDGTTCTPNTAWGTLIDENSDWTAVNDPCNLLLGTGWRIPTQSEWTNADNTGGWGNYNDTYASILKLHAAGFINDSGQWSDRGGLGLYWSSMQDGSTMGWKLLFNSTSSSINQMWKSTGISVRCLRD